ncbi:membrane cofactor protein [Nothobranchius furzeri]|uniref:EGF and pentraxin domain-containing protein 1-like n=1 Tax=Nothobranchius furzeri TaxID=105023 RepID=A0A9D2XXX6_NOTFU|nr:EGF and pentraxin domain-containing protein 1-like [Nothobranchius furzeri]
MNTAETVVLLSFAFIALGASKRTARDEGECSSPLEYPHAQLPSKSRSVFRSGEKVFYHCAEDFTAVKGSRSVQCVDGKWTKLSLECEKIRCGNAGDLPNGEFLHEGEGFIGEKVYADCKTGYALKGPNYRICKSSGWAGEFPSCEETCTAPTVDNSVQKGSVSKYFVGDIMNLTCKQGFQLNGAQTITCRPSGRWQPQPPRCVASKVETQQLTDQKVGCQAPPAASGSNVRLSNKYTFKTSFSSGDRVYYRCDVGYTSVGGSRLRMCFNGIWTPLTLICERMSCGHAGEFENGHFTYSGIHFGDKATAVCNKGYRLVGQGTRVCQSEGWDGRTPVCEVIKCEEPIKTNAARRNIQEAPYSYSNVLIYYCLEGILDGPSHIWCTENGTWSAPPPQCKVVTCPSPNVPHAFWVNGYRQKYNPNDTIDSFQCRRGYTLRGPKHITCTREGTWSPKLPSCQPRNFNYNG